MSARPHVSIIIPSAADPALLAACLGSIAEHAPNSLRIETIVVVNKPGGYEQVLRDSPLETTVVTAAVNLGLAGAANRARQKASGEFILIFHDDSQAEPGWLEALLDAAHAHPEAGAIGGTVLSRDGRVQSAGSILHEDGTTAPRFDIPPHAREVDYIGTSSLLIPASTWDALGGFDEQFYPVYYVDVDFAMRVRRRGQVVLHEPRSQSRHHQGASGTVSWRKFVSARNRQRFISKWSGPQSADPVVRSFDEAEQDERHRAMEAALQSEYASHLASLRRNVIGRFAKKLHNVMERFAVISFRARRQK